MMICRFNQTAHGCPKQQEPGDNWEGVITSPARVRLFNLNWKMDMKTIIRFLARISGVEQKIKNEAIFEIGCFMKEDAWWFSSEGYEKVYNVLHLYADSLKRKNKTPRIDALRERICSLGDNAIDGHDTAKILECESHWPYPPNHKNQKEE